MIHRLVLMGVAGCGKSAVGAALQQQTGLTYIDGDALHSAANIAKMSAGHPLEDADRWPWLDSVAMVLTRDAPVAVGCSALRRSYRDRIRYGAGDGVIFVYLQGSKPLIAARMAARTAHFMPLGLLDSQFAALEPPTKDEAHLTVSIDQPLAAIVQDIVAKLGPFA